MQHLLARFAPAKINLFLEVTGRRPDGYHDIVTVMETIAAGDLIEVVHAHELVVTATRPDVPSGAGNVAYEIVRAAEAALGRPLPARITIVKHVPPGSGLGAGSSDAVNALLLVLALHGLSPPPAQLASIAAAVGSDTAFFLTGGTAVCTGRGEIVREIASPGVRHFVLVYPAAACSTAKVYGGLEAVGSPGSGTRRPAEAGGPVGGPNETRSATPVIEALARGSTLAGAQEDDILFNRLAGAAESVYPELAERRAHLREIAGREPRLSGSGGTFFFLCPTHGEARALAEKVRAADPALEVRHAASYRRAPAG